MKRTYCEGGKIMEESTIRVSMDLSKGGVKNVCVYAETVAARDEAVERLQAVFPMIEVLELSLRVFGKEFRMEDFTELQKSMDAVVESLKERERQFQRSEDIQEIARLDVENTYRLAFQGEATATFAAAIKNVRKHLEVLRADVEGLNRPLTSDEEHAISEITKTSAGLIHLYRLGLASAAEFDKINDGDGLKN